jgi:hypothetical protein
MLCTALQDKQKKEAEEAKASADKPNKMTAGGLRMQKGESGKLLG